MKTTYILLVLTVLASTFTSCDIIDGNPYESYTNPDNPVDGDTVKKVVLIDFTGHRCPNCPNGHAEVDLLKQTYGSRLIPISVHAGTLARPTSSSTPPMPADYRTPFGTGLFTILNVEGIPIGVIGTLDGTKKATPNQWAELVMDDLNRSSIYKTSAFTIFPNSSW